MLIVKLRLCRFNNPQPVAELAKPRAVPLPQLQALMAASYLCLERLCHFLFQLGSISIRHAPAATVQALTEGFHLTVLAGDGLLGS